MDTEIKINIASEFFVGDQRLALLTSHAVPNGKDGFECGAGQIMATLDKTKAKHGTEIKWINEHNAWWGFINCMPYVCIRKARPGEVETHGFFSV